MKAKDYENIALKILQLVDEGVHIIDSDGKTIMYNEAMARLEKTDRSEVIKRPFTDVFKNMDSSNSTLIQALKNQKTTMYKQQTYHNKDGKEITTINSTVPVLDGEKVIAAIEVAKNITSMREMSQTILDLHKEKLDPNRVKEYRIKRYSFQNLIGQNSDFLKSVDIAKKAANNSASVFIYGETGTGKELIAQSIHFESERRDKPFLAQNCAALPESLLEGILFGTAMGGFTGAVDRPGLFEQANGGTLLLDEVSAMPYVLQGKLLRVLQEQYIRRVGGQKDIPIDVRIIATINEPAADLIARGELRKDLFYRLNVIGINLIPLRERKDDILLLADKFIEKHSRKNDKEIWSLSEQAKKKLLNYSYPGNVRELENIIVSGILMTDGQNILSEEFLLINEVDNALPKQHNIKDRGLDDYMGSLEKEIIETALATNSFNISKTAEQLRIKRQTLQHKIKRYQITKG